MADAPSVTGLLRQWRAGDQAALDRLIPVVHDELHRLAQGADLFLCEASYLDGEDNPPDLHLTGLDAGEAATKAGVARLVLTHLVSAWGCEAISLESAAAAFAGPIEIARAGRRFDV